jgi:hypothetical protein
VRAIQQRVEVLLHKAGELLFCWSYASSINAVVLLWLQGLPGHRATQGAVLLQQLLLPPVQGIQLQLQLGRLKQKRLPWVRP